MKLAFIDCSIAGVSGDMLAAALIDAGAPMGKVKRAMSRAGKLFGDVEIGVKRVQVSEIRATRLEVRTRDEGGRTYEDITNELKQLPMGRKIREAVFKTIEILGRAEAEVHGKSLKRLVLHEVGAADAISDIVGCCTAAKELGFFEREVLSSEVAVGKGTVELAHGRLPLPAPAVLEILRGKPIRGVASDVELTTPTGAALLVALTHKFVPTYPAMCVEKVGYGAGSREFPTPNVVRVCLGERIERELELERVSVLETNIDDIPGEVMGYALEELLSGGALDATVTPILMKKGRPGFSVQVIVKPEDAERLARVLMLQTGTLGVRVLPSVHRYALERETKRVDLKLAGRSFKARVKVSWVRGGLSGIAAEYEDAKKIAGEVGLPLREVMGLIEGVAKRKMRFLGAKAFSR